MSFLPRPVAWVSLPESWAVVGEDPVSGVAAEPLDCAGGMGPGPADWANPAVPALKRNRLALSRDSLCGGIMPGNFIRMLWKMRCMASRLVCPQKSAYPSAFVAATGSRQRCWEVN